MGKTLRCGRFIRLNGFICVIVTWLAAFVFYLAKNRGAQASLSAYQSTSENAYKSSEVYGASTEIPARFVSSYGGDNGVSGSYEGCGYASGPREHDGRVKEEFDDEEEEGDVGYAPLKYEPPERLGSPMHAHTGRATAPSGGYSAGTPPPRTESTKPLSRTMQMAKKSYDDPCEWEFIFLLVLQADEGKHDLQTRR